MHSLIGLRHTTYKDFHNVCLSVLLDVYQFENGPKQFFFSCVQSDNKHLTLSPCTISSMFILQVPLDKLSVCSVMIHHFLDCTQLTKKKKKSYKYTVFLFMYTVYQFESVLEINIAIDRHYLSAVCNSTIIQAFSIVYPLSLQRVSY